MTRARRLKRKEVLALALRKPIAFARAKIAAKRRLRGKSRVI